MGGCLHLGPTPLLGERDWGGTHATATTTVTEGTFPSHLELSKSRFQLASLATEPSLGPPPPGRGHTDTWRECAQQMLSWEVARNLTRPQAAMVRFVSEPLGSLLALRSTSATVSVPRKLTVQMSLLGLCFAEVEQNPPGVQLLQLLLLGVFLLRPVLMGEALNKSPSLPIPTPSARRDLKVGKAAPRPWSEHGAPSTQPGLSLTIWRSNVQMDLPDLLGQTNH